MSQNIVTVNGTQSLVLINTAVDTNTIVRLQVPFQSGVSVTIRDNAGSASASNSIYISTIFGVSLYSGLQQTSNLLQIQQPFGFVTLYSAADTARWNILNTFGFQPQNTVYNIESIAVSTIYMQDMAGGAASQINVSNGVLQLNGSNIQGGGGGGGGGGTIPDPLTVDSIQVSSITISSNSVFSSSESNVRLAVSGGIQTNFLNLVDQTTSPQTTQISVSCNTLYRNTYPISPVGAYIEFGYRVAINTVDNAYALTTHPLYLGTLGSILDGWWATTSNPVFVSGNGFINGYIVLPGYALMGYDAANLTGNLVCALSNTSALPLYSNVNNYQGYVSPIAGSYNLKSIS
jgi:hypothetical protein